MLNYIIKIKRKTKTILTDRWVWTMAWRDARHNFSRLFLFTASLVTGIASVVSLDSFNYSLQQDIDRNAKELLGADFVVNGDKKFNAEVLAVFDSIQLEQSSEATMASMVSFIKSNQSRLIRLVAFTERFPFYGNLQTSPNNARRKLDLAQYAIMDATLASQFNVGVGDSIKLGKSTFIVAGVVTQVPGGGGLMTTFTPSIYIDLHNLDSTGLVQYGSRVNYKQYFKTNSEALTLQVTKRLDPILKRHGYSIETVQKRKEELGRGFLSIYKFFSLLAFVALALGCIGVASSVHIYAREKREEVAILRCVGSSGWQAFNIYFIQIFLLGIVGSVVGSFLGLGIQQLIPVFLKGIIPFEISFSLSWNSLILGLLLGTVVSILFSILPLEAVRFVSPLSVLRTDFELSRKFSKTKGVVLTLIALLPIGFATWQTKNILTGLFFFLGFAVALGALTLVAWALLKIVRRYFPTGAPFIWRHALANLFRPNNQTQILMITIGLGTFIISMLNVIEKSMLAQVEFTGQENQSNTILFDIQPNQKEGVVKMMQDNKLTVNQVVPIITCRLMEIKGKSVELLRKDSVGRYPKWALTREYRVTYRDSLRGSEELIAGELQRKKVGKDSIGITISKDISEALELSAGDSLVFDMQGVPLKVKVAGIRKVNWPKDPPNFVFVFPTGVLENAPQIFVTATRIDNQLQANNFQQQLVNNFPNVSLIDLRLILSTVNELFNKLGLVIRFLALFSIVTGLVVLAGAVINSKFVRMKENVLLRTLGARTGQITKITLIEYTYLGLFSALTGVILALGGGFLLAKFFFEITFAFNGIELMVIISGIVFITVLIGWYNSRQVINTPPLQILRKES